MNINRCHANLRQLVLLRRGRISSYHRLRWITALFIGLIVLSNHPCYGQTEGSTLDQRAIIIISPERNTNPIIRPKQPVVVQFESPDLDTTLILDATVIDRTGNVKKRIVSPIIVRSVSGELGLHYLLGNFAAGDEVTINIMNREGEIYLSDYTLRIQRGVTSVRGGITNIGYVGVRYNISLLTRLFTFESVPLLKRLPGADNIRVGLNIGGTIDSGSGSSNTDVYFVGVAVEFFETVDIFVGAGMWQRPDVSPFGTDRVLRQSITTGLTFDLGFAQKFFALLGSGVGF